jgi:hypothetical protein
MSSGVGLPQAMDPGFEFLLCVASQYLLAVCMLLHPVGSIFHIVQFHKGTQSLLSKIDWYTLALIVLLFGIGHKPTLPAALKAVQTRLVGACFFIVSVITQDMLDDLYRS